jgi:DNA-binding beta-propeller fold protein YncE
MDDMQAFERRVADEMLRRAGPSLPVDNLAITNAVSATQSPKWRFQSMFSATKFVVAGVIVALFGGFLLTGVLTQPSDESVPAVGASASAPLEASPAVTDAIEVGGFIADVVATDDAVWVADPDAGRVSRIDATTREVTATIALDLDPVIWLVPAADAVWVMTSDAEIARIDLESRTVTDVYDLSETNTDLHADAPPLIAEGSLWAYVGEDGGSTGPTSLVEIDLATREVTNEYELLHRGPPFWAEVIDGAIWSWRPRPRAGADDHIARFDLEAREFTDAVSIGGAGHQDEECCVAIGDAIWLVEAGGPVRRFDLASLEVTDTLDLGPGLYRGIAAAGAIWVPDSVKSVVHRIDPDSREVTDEILIGDGHPAQEGHGLGVAFADGAIWVANGDDEAVSRIDVETRDVTHEIEVEGVSAIRLAFDGAIWVTSGDGTVTRIETGAAGE